MLTKAVGIASALLVAIPGAASAQATPESCTAQWLAKRQSLPTTQRFDRRVADAFGRTCLGVKGKVPIDWNKARSDVAASITTNYSLNSITPDDIDIFCPGYVRSSKEQRRDFWRALAYAVIKPEAGSNAHAIMWEQPFDNAGKPVGGEYSIGLLQLSISNRHPYDCDIPNEASLLEPARNLACGAKIMSYLVSRSNRIGGDAQHGRVGLAKYWSTIRDVSQKPKQSGKRETRQPIIAEVKALKQCRS